MLKRLLARTGSARARHARWMLSGAFVRAATGFASTLVLMRLIAPDGFGRFYIASATIGLVLTLLSPRLNIWLITIPDDELDEPLRDHLHHAILQEALILTALALAWLGIAGIFTPLNALLAVTLTFRLWVANHTALFERSQRYVRITLLETVAHLTAHGAAVVFALIGLDEAALYLREVILTAVTAVWLRHLGAMEWRGLRWVRLHEWVEIVRKVWGLWAEGLLESLFTRLEVLVVAQIGGETGAGYYSQARRLIMLPHQLLSPLTGRMALNWFSREPNPVERRRRRRQLMRLSFGVLAVAALGNVLLAEPVVPWVFGEQWRPVVPIMWALTGMLVLVNLFSTHKMFLMATRQLTPLLLSRVALMAGLLVALVPLAWGEHVAVWVAAAGVSAGFAAAFAVTSIGIALAERPGGALRGGVPQRADEPLAGVEQGPGEAEQ